MLGLQMKDQSKTQEVGYIGQHDHGTEYAAGVQDKGATLVCGARTYGRQIKIQIIYPPSYVD